jgi:transcriptional regulator with XRE-family HTH domain
VPHDLGARHAPLPDLPPVPNFAALRDAARQAREDRGYTVEQLAERANLSRDGVLDLLNGPAEGRIHSWWRLAWALDVEFSDLVATLGPTVTDPGE